MGNVINGRIEHTAWLDPELLKCILNDMVEDAGVKLYLHSWGTRAIVESGRVRGVIFESKSGRQAVLARVVIDSTGDGDIFVAAGAEFVKTSSGFGPSGAEEADVRRMRAIVGPQVGVKAAGGIRSRADLERMVRAGANRVGTSSGVKIMQEYARGQA